MAATVTAKSGHHIAYYRQQAAAGNERSPLSYYSAGAKQGGAEGRWFGRALPALGLHEGQAVDMEDNGPYTQVYNQANPLTGERLSRAPQSATSSRSPAAPSTGGAPPEQVRNADGSAATARSAVAAAGSKPGPNWRAGRRMIDTSYDVKFWKIETRAGVKKTTYRVHWLVGRQHFTESFPIKALADAFRSQLGPLPPKAKPLTPRPVGPSHMPVPAAMCPFWITPAITWRRPETTSQLRAVCLFSKLSSAYCR